MLRPQVHHFHMIDRCTRWHAAMVVPNKHEETLMKAIDTLWVATHGPPKELITDGESGIALSNLTKENMIINTAFFKKEAWERIGGYDVQMVSGLEDWEFWIALLKNGSKVKKIDEIGYYYKKRQSNGSKYNHF